MTYLLCLDCGGVHRCTGKDALDALIDRVKAAETAEESHELRLVKEDDDGR